MIWLAYVGLFQHETPCAGQATACPTVYGYAAPLPDNHVAGTLLLLAGFTLPAAWVGWRRLAPPLTIGASLALVPTILAWWTAPRGDNDGLWALIFWFLPVLGGLAAAVAAVVGRVGVAPARHDSGTRELSLAPPSDRLAALAIDVAIVGAVLLVPLTALSHGKWEVSAGVLGVASATAYLAAPLAWRGQTLGQSLLGLIVLDATTSRPVSAVRAVLRSLVVVLEVAAVPTFILAIPAMIEWASLAYTGRTVTDRIMRTVVLSERSPAEQARTSAARELAYAERSAGGGAQSAKTSRLCWRKNV